MTNLLFVSGSLRAASLNTALLRAARALAPTGTQISFAEIGSIPHYSGDIDTDEARPKAVADLKNAIARADGLVIATPEYNYGIPGVLKNAIDWASRPAYKSVFANKPVAILSASPGPVGGARAQGQLKQVLLGVVADLFPHPEMLIGGAGKRFDGEGNLIDESTREHLQRFMSAFVAYADERARLAKSAA